MSAASDRDSPLDPSVRSLQIIKFGLVSGVAVLAGLILFVIPQPKPPDDLLLVWILAGFGGLTLVARLLIPSRIVAAGLKRTAENGKTAPQSTERAWAADERQLASLYQIQLLVGSAILEAGAFANLVGSLLTGHALSWCVAGLLWIGLVIDFPTRAAVLGWIATQRSRLHDEQQLAGRFRISER